MAFPKISKGLRPPLVKMRASWVSKFIVFVNFGEWVESAIVVDGEWSPWSGTFVLTPKIKGLNKGADFGYSSFADKQLQSLTII